MSLAFDPIAREQLNEMRDRLGSHYVNAIWAQRAFEQEIRNTEVIARWRQSFPAWDRLFGRPAPSAMPSGAKIFAMQNGWSEDSKAA